MISTVLGTNIKNSKGFEPTIFCRSMEALTDDQIATIVKTRLTDLVS
jgi:hypothetical protein